MEKQYLLSDDIWVSFHPSPPTDKVKKGASSTPPLTEGLVWLLGLLIWVLTEVHSQLEKDFGIHLAFSSFKSFTENISVKPNIVGYPCVLLSDGDLTDYV